MVRGTLLFLFFVFSFQISAFDVIDSPLTEGLVERATGDVDHYSCNLTLYIDSENSEFFEKAFKAPVRSKTGHGGDPIEVSTPDGKNTLSVAVDGRWITLAWYRGDKLVTSGLSVIQYDSKDSRVLMLFDPQNDQSQLAVNCNPVLKPSGNKPK